MPAHYGEDCPVPSTSQCLSDRSIDSRSSRLLMFVNVSRSDRSADRLHAHIPGVQAPRSSAGERVIHVLQVFNQRTTSVDRMERLGISRVQYFREMAGSFELQHQRASPPPGEHRAYHRRQRRYTSPCCECSRMQAADGTKTSAGCPMCT